MTFYVYRGVHKETGQFYIGSRTSKRIKTIPSKDLGTNYFTSSKIVKLLKFENFNWEILYETDIASKAYDYEQLLIEASINHPLNINLFYRKKFSTAGKIWSEQERINHSKIQKGRIISENQKALIVKQVTGIGNPKFSGISNDEFKDSYKLLCNRVNGIPSLTFFRRWYFMEFGKEFPKSVSKFRFDFCKDLWPMLEMETGFSYNPKQKWDTKLNPANFTTKLQ